MAVLRHIREVVINSLRIFCRDGRRLCRTPVALFVVVGIAILPSLYAWCNIAAYGDPYAHTGDLKIAVANNDTGAADDAVGDVNAGAAIVATLKENDDFGWVFTSEEEALAGVAAGDYYAAIVVPADFSAALVATGHIGGEKPKLRYYINEKKNAIAPVLTNVGVETVQSRINHEFTAIVADAVKTYLDTELNTAGDRLEDVYAGILQDLTDVSANIAAFHDNVESFRRLSQSGDEDLRRVRRNLDDVTAAADSATTTLKQGEKTIAAGRDSLGRLSADLDADFATMNALLYDIETAAGADLGAVNGKLQNVNGKIDAILTSLQTINALNGDVIADLQQMQNAFPGGESADLLAHLKQENRRHQELLTAVDGGNRAIGNTANTLTAAENDIAAAFKTNGGDLRNTKKDLDQNVKAAMTAAMADISATTGTLTGLLDPVDGRVDQLRGILDTLSADLNDLATVLTEIETTLDDIAGRVDGIGDDLAAIRGYAEFDDVRAVAANGDELADFISAPIELKTATFYRVRNYGSAMAPFFTNLAIWIGGIMMLAVFKLEVAKDEKIPTYRPIEGYFGRWLLFILVGQAQALVVGGGDLLLLDIQCVHPLYFLAACSLASFVYINIIYGLAVAFRHVGKAFCIIFLIFQIPGSSGTYPVEMASRMFRLLHPMLPFTYSIDAMREAIAGVYGHHFAANMAILSAFLLLALVIGVVLRPLFLNLNALFDRKLGETDLMITEENSVFHHRRRLMIAIRLLIGQEKARATAAKRLARFDSDYNKGMRRVFRFIFFGLPLLLLLLLFLSGSKMLVLILWIISLAALALFLIVCEYIHDHYRLRKELSQLSDAELLALLRDDDGEEAAK